MAGTKAGGLKAKLKNLANDPDYYKRIGKAGGKAGVGSAKGFASSHELAVAAGAKGGRISRRRKKDVQKEN